MINRALGVVLLVSAFFVLSTGCGGGGGGGDEEGDLVVTTLGADGPGSLAQAVADAQSGDRITFEPGLSGTIVLLAELVLDVDLQIDGPGSSEIAVSGNDAVRAFSVPAGVDVTIRDVTVERGLGSGGGILNAGTLLLERVVVSMCSAPGTGRGGGLRNAGPNATVTVRDSWITGCSAYNGGGFANDEQGTMVIERSLVSSNMTTGNSGAGGGSTGTLAVVNSTFEDNQATGTNRSGGGLFLSALAGEVAEAVVVQSTFSQNAATGFGGGIRARSDEEDEDSGIPAGLLTLTIRGSVFSGNLAPSGPALSIEPEVALSIGNSLVGDGSDTGLVDGIDGNLVGTTAAPVDAMLGTLQDNGGPTLTRVPLASSPAIDAVPTADCLDVDGQPLVEDQRGFPRPDGTDCDMGAVETQP